MRSAFLILPAILHASVAFADESLSLRLERTIPLPGVEGRIDHLAADGKGKRLFVAALGNNTLEVVDLAAGKVVRSIGGLREPQGVAYLPEANLAVVAAGADGACVVYDGATLDRARAVKLGADADNVRYDAGARRVYVGYGEGALGVFDPAGSLPSAGEFRLAGHPESFQLETAGPRIFVNVPDAKQVAVVDREKGAVVATWPMTDAQRNYPMALDETNHRLFVGCRKPARLVVLDTAAGKEVAALDASGDADDLFVDAAAKRIYMICGEGFVDVFAPDGADAYRRVARVPTATGARTGLFVPDRGVLFVAVPHRGDQQAEIREFNTRP